MDLALTWLKVVEIFRALLDITIVWVLIYFVFKLIRQNVRMVLLLKGVIIVILMKYISEYFTLATVGFLIDNVIAYGFFGIIVIFQPEIRSALEQIGKNQLFFRSSKDLSVSDLDRIIQEVESAVKTMSNKKVGALITIERNVALFGYINKAKPIYAEVSRDLLTTIFSPNTALHDGAVIIQGKNIACASAYYPVGIIEQGNFAHNLGTRHRAAIGISEISDSITIVVSEETGTISVAYNGLLKYNVPFSEIEMMIRQSFQNSLKEEGK